MKSVKRNKMKSVKIFKEGSSNFFIHCIAIIVLFSVTGCNEVEDNKAEERQWKSHGEFVETKIVEIEGHKYIIMNGYYNGGIIHAESCTCKGEF